nr:hypothetical protein [uncultured Bacillus sp.]
MKKKYYNPYALPPWARKIRGVCCQFAVPFCVFQSIRVIVIPTIFDVLFLLLLICLAVALHLDIL